MEALDPQLRGQQQKPHESYPDLYRYSQNQTPQSPYTLNPIRQLPPPQQNSTLPSISQDPNIPYYGGTKQPDFSPTDEAQDAAMQSPIAKGDGQESQKRPRSCESCRALKVRCERDPSMTGPCKRCAKADRNCVFTEPSHKRKKKTDNKVAELEKKIDALTASLIAVQGTKTRVSDNEEDDDSNALKPYDTRLSDSKPGRKRRRSTFERGQDISSPTQFASSAKQIARASLSRTLATPIPPLENSFQNHEYTDVIDRLVLSSTTATEIFHYYREKMAPYLPAVVIPPDATMGDIRREKPILFLAIMSVASGHKYSNIQRTLTREIMQTYADRVVNKGEKSLELIQAMQISTIWHFAEDQNDTRAFQLIQMAAAMAVATKFCEAKRYTTLEFSSQRSAQSLPAEKEKEEVERKRAWLSCYILSGISAMNLRQQNTVHWSKFTDDAIKVFDTSDKAAPTDKVLCRLATLQSFFDRAIGLFFKEASAADISRSMTELEQETQEHYQKFEESGSHTVRFLYRMLLMYFTSLRVMITSLEESSRLSQPTPESKQDFLWKYGEPMSDTALKAGIPSVQSMQDALEIFLIIPRDHLDALPNVWYNRITYVIILLMFFNLRVIGSEKGAQITGEPVSLRVSEYLNRIMEKLHPTSHDDFSPAVHKFKMLLRMFKSWFERQRDGPKQNRLRKEPRDASQLQAEPIDSERNTPRQGYRKLSVHSESNSDNATKPSSKSPVSHSQAQAPSQPKVQLETRDTTSQPKPTAPMAPMGATPLNILSQVASNEPSASAHQRSIGQHQQHQHQQQPQESWYNGSLHPYAAAAPQPYVSDPQAYYQDPHQHDYTHINGNGYSMDGAYQHMVIDPELEQAMCSAFGSEGNIMGNFFNDFFSIGQGQNMAYGNWFPTSGQ